MVFIRLMCEYTVVTIGCASQKSFIIQKYMTLATKDSAYIQKTVEDNITRQRQDTCWTRQVQL